MTADYAYGYLKFVCRKAQTGEIPPSQYTYSVSRAQRELYDWLIGQLEGYQPNKPVPRVAVGMGQKGSNFLLPLKISNLSIPVVAGIATRPGDFDYLVLMTDSLGRKVERIDDSKKPGRLNSKIDPITDTSKPFFVEGELGWEIYPTSVTPVIVSYYFAPPNSVWGYTIGTNGRPVYEPSTSVAPVFSDVAMEKVLDRALEILGISFTEKDWVEYRQMEKQPG